jgi:NADPH-dependent 2,4-dienoyl-CoA reductase/sulfur reductase-like enzyme
MTRQHRVVIVGASLAGFSVADSLRREGYHGEIVLIGDEDSLPYDRPPLSKQVLSGVWGSERTALTTAAELSALGVVLRTGSSAVAASTTTKTVTLATGEDVDFDILVVATGLRPRTFGLAEPGGAVHVLRTIEDSQRLGAALRSSASLTVVGAGFLGLEIASTASQLGLHVTVVEPQTRPLAAVLDPGMAARIAGFFTDAGVRLQLGCSVTAIEPGSDHEGMVTTRLSNSSQVTSDNVVLALGAAPAADWLADSGVPVGDGVNCDAFLRAGESVFAVGDVASWHDVNTGKRTRIEHRTNAVEQAAAIAQAIVHGGRKQTPFTAVPYVWSDQLGHRLQLFGRPRSSDDIAAADTEATRPICIHSRDGRITGVVGLDSAKTVRRYSQFIGQPALQALSGA